MWENGEKSASKTGPTFEIFEKVENRNAKIEKSFYFDERRFNLAWAEERETRVWKSEKWKVLNGGPEMVI